MLDYFGPYGLLAVRGLYNATPAGTRDLGLSEDQIINKQNKILWTDRTLKEMKYFVL